MILGLNEAIPVSNNRFSLLSSRLSGISFLNIFKSMLPANQKKRKAFPLADKISFPTVTNPLA